MELTKTELADKCGRTVKTVDSWLKAGAPKTYRKVDGHDTVYFDVVDIAEWFAATKKNKYVFMLQESVPAPEPADDTDPSAKVAILKLADTIVQDAYRRYQAGKKTAQAAFFQEQWERAAEVERKLQKDWAANQLAMGKVMAISEHNRIFLEAHIAVAHEWKGSDNKMAPPLAACKTATECLALLKHSREDCMRHLTVELERIGESKEAGK